MYLDKDNEKKTWSLFALVGGILFLCLGSLLALTNPGQKQYEEFATEKLVTYLKENVCQQTSPSIEEAIKSQMCNLMVNTGKGQIPKLIEKTSKRHNYLFLSMYETNLYLYRVETIGVLNQFFIIGVEKVYDSEEKL
jgi:hypothetical protein